MWNARSKPNKVTQFNDFAHGLGYGLSLIFHELLPEHKAKIMNLLRNEIEIAVNFGYGAGVSYASLSTEAQNGILRLAAENDTLAAGLGQGFGIRLNASRQSLTNFALIMARKNEAFGEGLAHGIQVTISFESNRELIDFELKSEWGSSTRRILKSGLLSIRVRSFTLLDPPFPDVLGVASKSEEFGKVLASDLGEIFSELTLKERGYLIAVAKKSESFAIALGRPIGEKQLVDLDAIERKALYADCNEVPKLAQGLGEGWHNVLKRRYLPASVAVKRRRVKKEVFALARKNEDVATGLKGAGEP